MAAYNRRMSIIQRDLNQQLATNQAPVQLLLGPRQCGKSTLLAHLPGNFQEITFDDLQLRLLANQDPRLFLEQFKPPLLLDEVQYAPPLFSEIKRLVDLQKRKRLVDNQPISVLFRMTGSNQILMDRNIKESLAGRASYFYLNTLTVHEIKRALPEIDISTILYQGGWPELYVNSQLSIVQYLNDYIRSYIEKDVVLSAGIQKQLAFSNILKLFAARTGALLDYANIAQNSSVQAVTIKEWTSILQQTDLIYCLKPYANNLNKRLTKTPKLYFTDTGLAVRLQGWQQQGPMLISPQMGGLFETLVFAEIYKFIQNYNKDWQLYLWRTKEGEEIDFLIITSSGSAVALDAKVSSQNIRPITLSASFKKIFPQTKQIILVTFGGHKLQLSSECLSIPIEALHDYLITL